MKKAIDVIKEMIKQKEEEKAELLDKMDSPEFEANQQMQIALAVNISYTTKQIVLLKATLDKWEND